MNRIISYCRSHSDLLVFITLLIGSGVFSHLLTSDYSLDGGRKQVALTAKLLLAVSYLMSFGLILLYWEEFKKKFTSMSWLWVALFLWAAISLIFGQFNVYTLMRLVGLWGCALMGVMMFVCTRNTHQLVMILFSVCLTIILINVLYLEWAVLSDASARDVKGVFVQKNLLGHVSFLTLFISAFVFMNKVGMYRLFSIVIFMCSAWLLFLSTSMTSNLLIPIALLAVFASRIVSQYKKGWVYVGVAGIMGAVILFINWSELFALIGKSTTFTGRTSHWAVYWNLIEQQILMGYGYGACPIVEKQNYWLTAGSHSGYIELLYYIGLFGAVMVGAIIVMTLNNWWRIVKGDGLELEASFLFGFLVVFLALNIVETYMLSRSGLFWPLFVYVTLQLSWLNKKKQLG